MEHMAPHIPRHHDARRLARVLIIDDDSGFRALVEDTLTRMGFAVESRPDGTSGLTAFSDQEPHLVILDMMMPDLTGIEVLRKIRNRSDVPVLFLSSCANESDVARALHLGADDYILKPFRLLEFEGRVHALLRRAWGIEPARYLH